MNDKYLKIDPETNSKWLCTATCTPLYGDGGQYFGNGTYPDLFGNTHFTTTL